MKNIHRQILPICTCSLVLYCSVFIFKISQCLSFIAALLSHLAGVLGLQLDPVAVLRTASYLIEAVAIVPQLYMHYGQPRRHRRDAGRGEPESEEEESAALDWHFACRGGFRAVYVGCWVSK